MGWSKDPGPTNSAGRLPANLFFATQLSNYEVRKAQRKYDSEWEKDFAEDYLKHVMEDNSRMQAMAEKYKKNYVLIDDEYKIDM